MKTGARTGAKLAHSDPGKRMPGGLLAPVLRKNLQFFLNNNGAQTGASRFLGILRRFQNWRTYWRRLAHSEGGNVTPTVRMWVCINCQPPRANYLFCEFCPACGEANPVPRRYIPGANKDRLP
jgi:hypothetical protein